MVAVAISNKNKIWSISLIIWLFCPFSKHSLYYFELGLHLLFSSPFLNVSWQTHFFYRFMLILLFLLICRKNNPYFYYFFHLYIIFPYLSFYRLLPLIHTPPQTYNNNIAYYNYEHYLWIFLFSLVHTTYYVKCRAPSRLREYKHYYSLFTFS